MSGVTWGQRLGRTVCMLGGTHGEGVPHTGVRDKRGHVTTHSLTWTQLSIAARGTFGSPIPPWWLSWFLQLSTPGPGDPQLLSGAGGEPVPYGKVPAGVWLCEEGWSSRFGAGTGIGWLWMLPPPGAGGAWGRWANRTPGEQEQAG